MKLSESLVKIRPVYTDDHNMIYSSLLKSYQQHSFVATAIPKAIFFDHHKEVIAHLLETAEGFCAVNREDPSQIYGYIIYSRRENLPLLHYVYVKLAFRNMGFGKWLVDRMRHELGIDKDHQIMVTHYTWLFRNNIHKRGEYIFNPYILERLPAHGSSEAKAREVCELG